MTDPKSTSVQREVLSDAADAGRAASAHAGASPVHRQVVVDPGDGGASPAPSSTSSVQRQVARVRRRLILQTLVRAVIWAWVGALALSAVWFLLQPLLLDKDLLWVRWAVLGGTMGIATVAAVVVAVLRAPSLVEAALHLDERFRLKERVTTSLMLDPAARTSSAGLALVADANQKVEPLRVADRFPVRVPWTAALVPAGVVLLGALVYFYNPQFSKAGDKTQQDKAVADEAMKAEIDQTMKKLQEKRANKKAEEKPKSEEFQRIDAEVDKMAAKPHATPDEVKERIKEIDDVEKDAKKRQKELADRAKALKDEMKKVDKEAKKDPDHKDGPAKDLDKALNKGDFNRAREEADQLAKKVHNDEKNDDQIDQLKKKLEDPNLKPEERKEIQDELEKKKDQALNKEQKEELQKELKDIKDKVEQLTKNDDEAEKQRQQDNEELQRQLDDKKDVPKEELDREKEELKKENEEEHKLQQQQMQDLKDLAQKLGEAQQAMKDGKDGEAAQKLQEAGDKLGKLDADGEQKALAQQVKQMQAMKKAMAQALDKQGGPGAGGQQGKNGNGQGNNQAAQGSGVRGESKDMDTKETEEQVRSDLDKGKLQVLDHVQGDGFKGARKPVDMQDEIRRAAQEGAEASDRERLPKSAADMTRGFFEKMRPPDADAPKPAKP